MDQKPLCDEFMNRFRELVGELSNRGLEGGALYYLVRCLERRLALSIEEEYGPMMVAASQAACERDFNRIQIKVRR